ncbi:MAG: GNAT family N-acetyltransferase [Microthrixaceae bacterium]|nr:GNAT family N-acetyltransferase [Microthrixaceae bacterium]
MVVFRQSSPDAADAHELLTEYFAIRAQTFPPNQGGYRTVFPDPAAFEPPAGVFLIADAAIAGVAGGEVRAVGCGGIRRIDDGPLGTRYEVKHLYLRPETRGHGWGRAMLDALERHARDLGARELVLDTHHTLEAAGGLYASSGFVPIEPYNDNSNATRWYGKPLTAAQD